MSLPVVSYGKYNYGQYSNPTPIRFTGGFGAGIAQGITTGVKEIVRQTQEKRKKEDAANLASAKAQIQFQAATDAYLKSATEENKAFLIQQKQFRGETERLFALKQISLDDYTKRVSASQGLLSQLKQLSGLVTDLSKVNNGQDIDDLQLRNNPDAFDANIKLQALVDGKFKIKGNYEDGFDVELPMYQSAMGTGEEIKEYAVVDTPLTQLLQNTKLYTPELAYINAANPNLNKLKNDLKKDIVTQGFTVFNDVEDNKEQEFIDINKKNEINQFLLNTKGDAILSTLDAKQKRIYYEDNIKKELGSWTGSEEQIQELKSTLVNEITDEFAGIAIGSKINKRKTSTEERTLVSEENRKYALLNAEKYKAKITELAKFFNNPNNITKKKEQVYMTPAQYQKAINAASGAGIILTPVIPDGINATGFKVNSDDKTVASLTESMPLILAGYDVNFGLATLRNVSGMKAGRQPIIAVDPDLNPNR
tara:strand:+ start:19071 stop:20510 length:1440 start_codon:yes stop_codon:yes gene_type:complete